MNYLTMANRVLLKAGESVLTSIVSSTNDKGYYAQLCVLDAVQELVARIHLKCLRRNTTQDTSDGTQEYNLATTIDHIYNVTCETEDHERKLMFMNQDELDILYPDPDDSSLKGEPQYYTEFEYTTSGNDVVKILKVYPCPDGVYTLRIRYYAKVSDMTAATDVPTGIDAKFHPMIVDLAYAKYMQYKDLSDTNLPTMLAEQAVRNARKVNRGMLEGKARITFGGEISRVRQADNPLESDL